MAEYIEKAAILSKCEEMWNNADETTQTGVDTINAIDRITDFIEAMPAADVQPVDEITKIIQARLNGVQEVKIDAMLSGDSTTAYKMVGAETVCIAILQDLEALTAKDGDKNG